jgi:hypothetical protein
MRAVALTVLALGAAGGAVLGIRAHDAEQANGGPVLLIAQGEGHEGANDVLTAHGVPRDHLEEDARAASLALATMDDPELEQVEGALLELNARLDVRSNPLSEDLDEDEPQTPLLRVLRRMVVRVTAASAITSHRWMAPERTLVVAPADACGPSRQGLRCVPAWHAGRDEVERRARYFAWPLTDATLLTVRDADDARRAKDALRARANVDVGRIALALGPAELEGRAASPRVTRIREAARRATARARGELGGPSGKVLAALARESHGPVITGVHLAPNEILVVPRLGTLADIGAFVGEVKFTLASAHVEATFSYTPR